MTLLEERVVGDSASGAAGAPGRVAPARETGADERAARRALRLQIERLEGELAGTVAEVFPRLPAAGIAPADGVAAGARILDLGELERERDELVRRAHAARAQARLIAAERARKRAQLQRMLLDPAEHKWQRVTRYEVGEPGCGAWHVRPRLGLLGMLMGWWEVKLSSGCP